MDRIPEAHVKQFLSAAAARMQRAALYGPLHGQVVFPTATDGSSRDSESSPQRFDTCAGNVEAVKALVDAGADVSLAAEGGVTALHAAAELGSLDLVHLLLKVPPLTPCCPLHSPCSTAGCHCHHHFVGCHAGQAQNCQKCKLITLSTE